MMGWVALGYARYAVPKTAGGISRGEVALGVAGLRTDQLRATVAELWLEPLKISGQACTSRTLFKEAKS